MSKDVFVWGFAAFAIAVALVYPGGIAIGVGIAFVILGSRYGLPFLGDLIRTRQRGVGSAKIERRARDAVRGNTDDTDGGEK